MCPGWSHLWHVVRGHAVKGWLAGFSVLVQIAHIGPPPPLLPLPHPRDPPGPAPTSSAASSRCGVVPGFETGGGERSGVRSPAPAGVRRGLYTTPPLQLDWWVGLCHGEVVAVCCHADMGW